MPNKKTGVLEMIDVVDKDDNVIGQMTEEDAIAGKGRFRMVHVILINDDDTLLVQWRKADKVLSPRTFTASAAGKVHSGETYEQAAIRELKEEMGASRVTLKHMGDFKTKMANGQLFAGVWNGEPKGWEAEADALDYWNRDEAEFMLKRFPYLISTSFQASLKMFLKVTK